VDLALAPGAQRDELGPVSDQLTQLPRGRWRDPRLGQPAHPEQIGQVSRVPRPRPPTRSSKPSPPTAA
jgi:hypothetical protein